jgi:hypothetical protein
LKFYEHLGDLFRRAFLYGGPGGQCNLWMYWQIYLIKHLKFGLLLNTKRKILSREKSHLITKRFYCLKFF